MSEVDELEPYLEALSDRQRRNVQWFLKLLNTHAPNLKGSVDQGKWFGGLLTFYTNSGEFCFALGPRAGDYTTFHMHPYYCSPALQQKHGSSLKRFLSGKSCIKFKQYTDLPEDALIDIIKSTCPDDHSAE